MAREESSEVVSASLLAKMPYGEGLGVRLVRDTPERMEGALEWSPARCTAGGVLHGGVLMSLADTLGALCAYLNLPPGTGTSTGPGLTSGRRPDARRRTGSTGRQAEEPAPQPARWAPSSIAPHSGQRSPAQQAGSPPSSVSSDSGG